MALGIEAASGRLTEQTAKPSDADQRAAQVMRNGLRERFELLNGLLELLGALEDHEL